MKPLHLPFFVRLGADIRRLTLDEFMFFDAVAGKLVCKTFIFMLSSNREFAMSFDIDKEALRASVFKHHYVPAVESINKIGRYWFGGTRQLASMVATLLEESGMSIILHNAPPRWEFVVYLAENGFKSNDLDKIALHRHELIEQGVAERDLPL